ncbi:Gfo/Idh/MocA family protein [Paenibacillus roseipurpureus]|uniref:Gfo/Idh/MocA family oxidoreductase n=1 Tax=Paenibacillus roseopurpureus TaxID=2918901 RepID=A0AA96RJA7_9BACL|nr:Gfo/Idh/MocA family oxidoreductase [Paenibacillus sp. MBLB1832]WNR42951.1 Gfo/Idh/MocA family oxidoreductase [Paenibacillus sp. MBLB1832]
METKLRWGILGSSMIARIAVIPAIQASETGIVRAVASRSEEKAKQTAEKFEIPFYYGSYEELLADPEIDAVYIPLPNHLHYEWTIRSAQAGKHILCEKPLALNSTQAGKMVAACEEAGVRLSEAFMYRFHPRIERIQEIIRSGEIGEIRAMHGSFTFNNAAKESDIRFHADWGGGGLYDVGCYPLSAARLILGQEPEAVTCHALFSPNHGDVDMMASGLVEFPGGVALTFDCGMWAEFRHTLEILGTKGRIVLPQAFLAGDTAHNFLVITGKEQREEQPDPCNPYLLEVDDFARNVAKLQTPRFPPQDAILNMRLLEACLRSARERKRIIL